MVVKANPLDLSGKVWFGATPGVVVAAAWAATASAAAQIAAPA